MRHFPFLLLMLCSLRCVDAGDRIDFVDDVAPILQKYCVGCHNESELNGELNLESHAALIKGGESGLAVTVGTPHSSRMLLMIAGKLEPIMPPEGEQRPTQQETAVLQTWVEQGAVGPSGDTPIRRSLRTPKIATAAGVLAPITAIAASPDGKLKAMAKFGQVDILREDALLTTLADQPGKVNSLQFNHDGTALLIASGVTGAYGRAAVYATHSGELINEIVGHRDAIHAAVFSPDQALIATAGYDREIMLWDARTGEPIRKMSGHNGAIFDLAFSPNGRVLASACADETVKIWNVKTGARLDTLSQPEGEVYALAITSDGKHILAGSADNRLRVWRLLADGKPRINPMVATRFIDESPLVDLALTADGETLVVLSEGGNVKLIRTSDWYQTATLAPLGEIGSGLIIAADGSQATIALLDGRLVTRSLPSPTTAKPITQQVAAPIYLDLGDPQQLDEVSLRKNSTKTAPLVDEAGARAWALDQPPLKVGRAVEITGTISDPQQADYFQWSARAGEVWAIDADPQAKSPIDPIVTVYDQTGHPVLRTRLQAVRDSYFTFRGKNSTQVNDFRVFNWQEMRLGEYLYAAGEVSKLWMHPRGPDSGFNVYPGEGQRWSYFGTTHATHALSEPAYIVRPLPSSQPALANGLPVFDVFYENDDDPMRHAGVGSRLLFTAPQDGDYVLRITDTTDSGGDSYRYKLAIRPAAPRFEASVQAANGKLRKGTGREFTVRVNRFDGFDGEVHFEVTGLPAGVTSNSPITIEAGQHFAVGTIWADANASAWEGTVSAEIVARGSILGREVERRLGKVGELTLTSQPNVVPSVQPVDRDLPEDEDWTLQVRRGETATARVVVRRQEGFQNEVRFGNETSGRNTSQGVYVDNIGLSGLLILANKNEREFFLTADETAVPGKRSFFLKANVDGGVTTHPITVEVLP